LWFLLYYLFIQVEVNHASEIGAIFDSISYDKGASVIRLLESYLGAERFQVKYCFLLKKYSVFKSCLLQWSSIGCCHVLP
jgi:aminopeptidase N